MSDSQIKEIEMENPHHQGQMEMPRYQSHKEVHALKINKVEGCEITPADGRYAPFMVEPEMYLRYTPTAGDYYVVYADGYKSFSPGKAFEEGYTQITPK
jgi:hypothetical protein